MSRAKLESLGLNLPLYPTSTVGSFPKPDYLTEARGRAVRHAITRSELDALERTATEFWIRAQEDLGIDVLVDGEQYRGDMVAYFAETMGGFSRGGLVRESLLSQAADLWRRALAWPDHRGLVALDAVADRPPGQGNADRTLHDHGLVVQ